MFLSSVLKFESLIAGTFNNILSFFLRITLFKLSICSLDGNIGSNPIKCWIFTFRDQLFVQVTNSCSMGKIPVLLFDQWFSITFPVVSYWIKPIFKNPYLRLHLQIAISTQWEGLELSLTRNAFTIVIFVIFENIHFHDFSGPGNHNYLTLRATKSAVSIMVW